MTGIDRLRTLAGAWDEWGLGGALMDVADQIERELREKLCESQIYKLRAMAVYLEMNTHVLGHEGMEDSPVARWARELREALGGDGRDHAEDVSMSAYDLLPEEERDAIAWVREHGGLDSVRELLDWVVGHCSTRQQLDFDFWLSGRVMYELGFEEDMADRDEVERRLLARLMPEDMEWLVEAWPRYEDGKPLRIGDFVGDVEVRSVVFRDGGILLSDCTSVPGWGTWRSYKEPIKRPSKVLDADGADTSVGDTVYDVDTGEKMLVCALPEQGAYQCVKLRLANGTFKTLDPCRLTHERPDSWERIEKDAEKDPCGYFGFDGEETCGKCPASGKNCEQTMARDLVRRARALAGVSE